MVMKKIETYISEINKLLPYSTSDKETALEDLSSDIQDALNADVNADPYVIFGSPREVAKNISKSYDWKTKPASWGIRTLAFVIDFILLMSLALISLIIGFSVLNVVSSLFDLEQFDLLEFLILFGLLILFVLTPIVIMFSYFVVLEKQFSTTIGKKIFGLKTVDISGIKPTWKQVIIRNFTKFQGEFLPFDIIIGMMMAKEKGAHGRYQRATEILADTMVIKNGK